MNRRMKKIALCVALTIFIIVAGSTALMASETTNLSNFIDVNNDGICDRLQSQITSEETGADQTNRNGLGYVDEDGNGICDHYEARQDHQGTNYIDANGDGICDNAAVNSMMNRQYIQYRRGNNK